MPQPSRVVLDVTSFISAEEFILAQNRGQPPQDPFAEQCYAEVVQSLIFVDEVLVPHPTRLDPEPEDYGTHPMLLRLLFSLGFVRPLRFSPADASTLADHEQELRDALDMRGAVTLQTFIDTTRSCDDEQQARGCGRPMLRKIVAWSNFQDGNVRTVAESHKVRIGTSDGIEADPFGDWARLSARSLESELGTLLPSQHAQAHLTAALARSLRYVARANAKQLTYQPHPLRRDFCVTFDLADDGASEGEIIDVVREIRGIHRGLVAASGVKHRTRLQLLALELPLLGGRLWDARERGRYSDERWLELTCDRLRKYRYHAAELRQAVSRCIFEEDKLRLKLDFDRVRERLLMDLGLKQAELNETERDLIDAGSSAIDAVTGLPIVRPLLIGGRMLGKKLATTGNAYQKFVYREFIGAWKRSRA